MFKMAHEKTSHELEVKPRTDRTLLVSLYEQGTQICMIDTTKFHNELTEEQKLTICKEIMTSICRRYANDNLPKGALYLKRDEMPRNHPRRKLTAKETNQKKAHKKRQAPRLTSPRRKIPRGRDRPIASQR